jgi:coenzyme F420-reducing hydrogenase delta subunit
MAELVRPDVIVYVCSNSMPDGLRLPRQWKQQGVHVVVREMPCSGKVDVQYLFHALEGGVNGLCVVTCPEGECQLAQGNFRADVRVRTVRRLLAEIGCEPKRVELVRCPAGDSGEEYESRIREAVERILALGESPICSDAAI